jgi:hypothetical protein
MYRCVDGQVIGVLNDWDLAAFRDKEETTSKQRTGTRPFMAIDRLLTKPPRHMYRHDLESLFYVLIWFCTRYDNGQEIESPPLENWAEPNRDKQLAMEKASWYTLTLVDPTPNFMPLKPCMNGLRLMIGHCLLERCSYKESDPQYFDETFGGLLTFDTFRKALDIQMDSPHIN